MHLLRLLALSLAITACSSGGGSSGSSGSSGAGGNSSADQATLFLPLIGEPPGGLDRAVLAPALAAAKQGLGFDYVKQRTVPLPVAPSELFIRPGVEIFPESIFPSWCTAGFVFDNRTRIATAGHCTQPGDAVFVLSVPSTIFVIGFTSQSTGPNADHGSDFALIDILPFWQPFTDPAVALVGGPCGQSDNPSVPLIKYVGHAEAIGTGGTARAGIFLGHANGAFQALGPVFLGDSGGPVVEATRTDANSLCVGGAAIGMITAAEVIVLGDIPLAPTGVFVGTPISRISNALDSAGLLP